jgi:glycosyltransferase involved in cell wall biosynthesis
VAFFSDSYAEVNGVARTSRALVAFAEERGLPMLCVHGGATTALSTSGSVTRLSLERGPVGFGVEGGLRFDLLLWRHRLVAADAVRRFAADLVHVTGPSDIGQLGAYLAHRAGIPLLASWHTNLHDYAALRLNRLTGRVPERVRRPVVEAARRQALRLLFDFYRIPRRVLAPNPELVDLIAGATGRPVDLMPRGVDTTRFSPAWATPRRGAFRIGYVGRLSPEKNVRMLAEIEQRLLSSGKTDIRMVIVGDGPEREWLGHHLRTGELLGILEGERLSRAYADLDVFVFPSESDTFGNVILEALAAGTPVVAAERGGPRFIVQPGVSGYLATDASGFAGAIAALMDDRDLQRRMRDSARRQALEASWSRVFEGVYASYRRCLDESRAPRPASGAGLTFAGRAISAVLRTFSPNTAVAPAASARSDAAR